MQRKSTKEIEIVSLDSSTAWPTGRNITEFDYPEQQWKPWARNWFCSDAWIRDDRSSLYPALDYEAWVFYKKSASIRLSVKTSITNHDQPILKLDVKAGFEPAGYEDKMIPRFLEPYQDEVGLKIQPKSDCIKSIYEYKPDIESSANKNKYRETEQISGHWVVGASVGGGIQGFGGHVEGHVDYHTSHVLNKCRINDFELSAKASNHSTSYRATQYNCYYPGENAPRSYDSVHPHDSMHWIALPNYFCEPSYLARGGLVINSKQSYVLNTHPTDTLTIPVHIKTSQRLVGMCTWAFGRNWTLVNYARLNFYLELSIRGNESLISKAGFFSDKHARINNRNLVEESKDMNNLFGARYAEERRGDSMVSSIGRRPRRS
ncbi:MAG: hypothetical protein ABI597_11690 [Gammaproteobacteria bacterium]